MKAKILKHILNKISTNIDNNIDKQTNNNEERRIGVEKRNSK